jgi:2',3'-cyclic-nucleotide 2'-phosphodiesterase (5'-nucleotidase family)
MRPARYPVLGANVQFADGRDVDGFRTTLLRVGSVKVGVIGILPWNGTDHDGGERHGSPVRRPRSVVNARARALRGGGADAVVVVAHAGAFCGRAAPPGCNSEIVELARGITERVDAIVTGHTHSLVNTRERYSDRAGAVAWAGGGCGRRPVKRRGGPRRRA